MGGARGTGQRKHDSDTYLLRIFMGPPWTKKIVSKMHLVAPPRALVHAQPGVDGVAWEARLGGDWLDNKGAVG